MSVPADTRPLPVQTAPRRRRHPVRNTLITLVVLVVLLGVAAVVGDNAFRAVAEQQISASVVRNLPPGVSGTVTSSIGGPSAFVQWMHGRFDDVTLTSKDLRINGGAASAKVLVHDLPVNGTGRLGATSGTLTIGQASLRRLEPLAQAQASAPRLGDGTVSTSVQRQFLGIDITVDVTLVPSVRGSYVRLNPTKAQLRSGPISVPGTALIKALLPDGISVCAAKYLPPKVRLTDLKVKPSSATLAFTADGLVLSDLQQGVTGSCS
ncbi:DUF2993 domain-containing protein [Amnibacterium sp. CER49]|uniref:LmeA family phospholipid-binding protein n=1 Tax=Amnibacterium sp. CER49 TaxID=3039161 RepID=UPI0024476C34|nr:DUF2993 domain-containing protein [Amnibacterium sp. CER49]MDH2445107.1 DUF2993 domain-containing protein [Amnibacterium sp. CER49]